MKRVESLAEDMIREGLILQKPIAYGLQVSLNPRRHKEIQRIVEEYVDKRMEG